MKNLLVLLVVLAVFSSALSQFNTTGTSTKDVVGYWENWGDVKWWDNYIPGNCAMGCPEPAATISKTLPYSMVNYGFVFLTGFPNPDQVKCTGKTDCPIWDGKGLYIAKSSMAGSTVVSDTLPLDNPSSCTSTSYLGSSSGVISISEMCRLVRQGGATNGLTAKRCQYSFGGWSDWAALGNAENAKKAAVYAAKVVAWTFLDGIDLDFEHLTPFESLYPGEKENFGIFVVTLRQELDKVRATWYDRARSHFNWLSCTYNALQAWEQPSGAYYTSNMKYMQDILANPVPPLTVSFTTRFNAFVPIANPYNYLQKTSPVPATNFATDNEGMQLWPTIGNSIDAINIMAYDAGSDAGPLKLDFKTIFKNFEDIGGIKKKVMTMGLEPGEQNGEGVWEGYEADVALIDMVGSGNYGGAMFWAINANSSLPENQKYAPQLASYAQTTLKPVYPYSPVPKYSKVNPSTGWSV